MSAEALGENNVLGKVDFGMTSLDMVGDMAYNYKTVMVNMNGNAEDNQSQLEAQEVLKVMRHSRRSWSWMVLL
jgi:hypothetical protein